MDRQASASKLGSLLGFLKALYQQHQSAHWQVVADYGDHLLFERLYENLPDEIDTLAEKIVASYGGSPVDAIKVTEAELKYLKKWAKEKGPVTRSLKAEQEFQKFLDTTLQSLATGALTTGMESFLGDLADKHETAIYLLKQRMAPTAAGRLASRYLEAVRGTLEERRQAVKDHVRKDRTWFEFEDDVHNTIIFTTRDHGDVADGEPGGRDLREARSLYRALHLAFNHVIKGEVDVVDEWVSLIVTIK